MLNFTMDIDKLICLTQEGCCRIWETKINTIEIFRGVSESKLLQKPTLALSTFFYFHVGLTLIT